MSKQINIPTLRFPEFKGQWERKKLGEVAEFKAGYAFKSEAMLSEKSNYQLLKMSNVYQSELRLDRNPSYWENINEKQKEFILKKGDSILTLTGTVGKRDYGYSIMITEDDKYLLNQRLVLLREKKGKSENGFINHILSNERFLFYFFGEAKGGTGNQTNVGTEDVKNIELSFPTLPEQTKIASFLTAVDEKLQALKKKKGLLENYKKGVMQRLLSESGFSGNCLNQDEKDLRMNRIFENEEEENPEILKSKRCDGSQSRFRQKDGKPFPDWEMKKLGEIGTFQTSSIDKLTKDNEKEVYLVNYMNVYRHENINNESIKAFQIVTAKDNQIKSCNLRKGDILFTPSSETPDDIGHSVVIFEDIENAVFSYHLMRFRPNIEIDILYSHYFCNIPDVLKQLTKLATGSTRFTISVSSFSSIIVNLPCLAEQTKIANFLSAIDEKIKYNNTQIRNTETWKKGLLQKMFV